MYRFEALRVLFKHRGIVYGSFLRDLFSEAELHSADVIVPAANFNAFHEDMLDLGYQRIHGIYLARGKLLVEAHVYETEESRELPNSFEEVTYDVNLLAYDGSYLYDWDMGNDQSVPGILNVIRARRATLLNSGVCEWELRRQTKILLHRGFNIETN